MKYLLNEDESVAMKFTKEAARIALLATCTRSKCGCVIVSNGKIIGRGYNSPPHNLESQRRCSCDKKEYDSKVTDKTCCVHAEQRAMMDALITNPEFVSGSRLYFIRLDDNGEMSLAGEPYCTICSKMALDAGVSEFVLWNEKGFCVYDTQEYNLLSYSYKSA